MKIVLCLFVVAAFIATGEALKCYQCSANNTKCDAFDKSAAGVVEQTCPLFLDRCIKNSALLTNGTSVTARGCSYALSLVNRAAEATIESTSSYYCSTDLCNGVSSTVAALTTLMVVIAPLMFNN